MGSGLVGLRFVSGGLWLGIVGFRWIWEELKGDEGLGLDGGLCSDP